MELPNYSRQLMQQLYTLRKEGQFCDCTILLGVTPYRAHKLVLAASSLLFKSLLENSETISIDPSVATSDEFANLLEMIYTGKLPPGKHNFTKVISIADSLQMFDVAVSCKNILNSLLKRSTCEQAEPSSDASCAESAPDHTRDNQAMVPAAVTTHQSENNAPELSTTLNFKEAQEDAPHLEEVHQQLSEIGDLERSTKPIFSAEVKDGLTEECGIQDPSEGSHEDSPPRKRCRLALSDRSEDDLEVLVQSRNRIAETIKDAQPLIHLVETCESLSSSEKQIILDCCKEDQVGPNVFDRLLNKVTDEKSLPVDTLLSVLDLLRDSYPELNNVLQTRSLREDSCAAQTGAAPEERRFFDLLLAHVDELGDSVTELSPITECLEMATEGFLTELEKETVLECCKGVSPKEAIANLLNKVTTEKSVDQTSLLKLLHAVKEAFPNLQLLLERLEAEWTQRGGTEEKRLEEYGAELLRRYHENLSEILSEPQPLTDSLAAAGDIPTEEREFMKRVLEEDKDPGSFGRLISVVLEERSIQTLSVWRMLLRAQGGIPLLALLIEEIRRDPDADKLIQSVFDKESRALDILFRHKELVTETIDDLGALLACVAQGVECPTGEAIEIIRNCCKKEGPRETVTNLLSKILEEKSISALPFCKLLCIVRESFPNLMPLIEELEQAEELMELPNYSRQLMQQLYTLRKEGQFCDCTILLGVTPYRAHKLVLAASSLLFKSLLENSETISIDPSVATSDEFANLLEMIYTGKLPPGKHNFTKVISIADSLQMFDVAVSCKNILNSLLKRSTCEQAEPSSDASCAESAPDHTRDNQAMVPAAVTTHQSENNAPELSTTLNFKEAQEDAPHLEEVHQQLSEIGDLERSTKPIFSAEVKDGLTEESGIQDPSEGSHEDSPPRKRCRLALSDRSEDDLEVLVQSRNRIAETIKDAQPLIHLVETCESLSSSEKQIILDCCKEDQVGPNVFDRLLNKVTDEKSLPVDTLLSVLDLLRDSYPELNNVLQTRSLREDSCAAQTGAAPEERRFFDLLLAHVDELGDSVTELSPITECLEMATEGFLTELEKETVLECCKGVSPKEAIANLLNKVTTEKSVDQTSLLKLLHAVKEAFPNLQLLLERLEAEWTQRGGTEEKRLEEYGAELLRRYHENLSEILSEPQPLTDSLAAAGDIPTEEREFMKRVLEEDKDPGSFGRLISVVLEERSIQTLSVWRMLLRAQGGIPLLALLIEEIRRDPDADKLIQSVFDKESRALDILFRHKELVTETIDDLGALLACVAQGVECPTGEAIEIIRNCCNKEGPRETVTNLLSKILEEKSISALPFCKLLCIVRESFPNLMPLIEELEQAETETEDYAKGKLKKCQVSGAEMEVMLDEESSPSEVKEETQKRSSKQGFTCKWCDKSFEFKCRMEVHLKRCRLSSQAPVECPECGETVASLRALQLHTSQSHGDAPRKKRKQGAVTCDICGKSFAHQSGMLYHKRADHFDEKPYSCDQCGAKFAANSTLKNHKRLHTGERPFFCKHCDMMFTQAAALAYHTKKKHSEGKMYACQYCDNVFAQSIELTRHVRTHTGDKPYVCRECGKGFSQANGLSVHLHTFHNIEDPYDCQKCRMSFPTLDEHKKHIQVVHPREYYPCETCSKVFSASSVLERHMVTHVGGKPFKCEICNKAYQQLSGLWYHNRTHHPDIFAAQNHRSSKFASFPCSSCDKSFPNITSLKRHMKAEHADAELYECQSCKEVFSTLGLLKKHTTTKHTGALQNHVGTEHFSHDGEAFRCGHCDLLLPSQQALEQHFQTQHPGAGLAQTPATAAQMVIQASAQTEVSEELIALEESQLGRSQVYVALADSQNNASGSEIVAVSMEDLLDGTVTLICGAEAQ